METHWNSKTKKKYVDLGYQYTNLGDVLFVKVQDLSKHSREKVDVQCDYCGKIFKRSYEKYLIAHDDKLGDCCNHCKTIKIKNTCQQKYGVESYSMLDECKEKVKQTCLEHFGVEYSMQSPEVKEKAYDTNLIKYGSKYPSQNKEVQNKVKQTMLERYGVEWAMQSEDIIAKSKQTFKENFIDNEENALDLKRRKEQTCMDKYGYNNPSQVPKFKDKMKQTCLKRYGVEYALQAPEIRDKIENTVEEKYGHKYTFKNDSIRQKAIMSYYQNGSCPTSKQQLEIHSILNDIYGNSILNYPCGKTLLDCKIEVDGVSIDIEYDGAYWHQDEQRDRRRDEFVKSQGYKVLRIIGGHKVPTKEQIIEAVDYLVKDNHSFAKINLNI